MHIDFSGDLPHEPVLEPFLGEYLKGRRDELPLLKERFACSDSEAIQKVLHNWKGGARPYGFGYLAELADEAELSLLDGSLNMDHLLEKVEAYLGAKAKHLGL